MVYKNKEGQTICKDTVMDSGIPYMKFDSKGYSQFSRIYKIMEKQYPQGIEGRKLLKNIVKRIKKRGAGNEYDCIVGVSGGTDSTYLLWLAKRLGLRPLAVHFDYGWASEIAVKNIYNATKILDVDLYTKVADWEEFKDFQRSFFFASVPDVDVTADYAIISSMYEIANKFGIKYILSGHSFRSEGTSPIGWTYMDGRYISEIQKEFGNRKLKSFKLLSILDLINYSLVSRIKFLEPLDFLSYNKSSAKKIISQNLEWEDYGGHHYESIFTKFFQSFYLPKKFNIDKRKRELSALILSNEMTRDEALEILQKPIDYDNELVDYVVKKLEFSNEEFERILQLPNRSFRDYKSYYNLIILSEPFIKRLCNYNFLPMTFYLKYFE